MSSAPASPGTSLVGPAREHFVRFYESEKGFAEAVAAHIGPALQAGGAALLIATHDHAAAVANRLATTGHDLNALRAQGRLVELNAGETLAHIVRDGWPDPQRFQEVVERLVARTIEGVPNRRLTVYGEMVALLCAEGKHAAALQLEHLWNSLGERHDFALCCGYPIRVFAGEEHEASLASVCAAHARVVPTESHTGLGSEKARIEHVIELQRKSLEVDRERSRRLELEDALHRRERELAQLLESIQDGVLDIDPDGRIRAVNRAYLSCLGYGAADHVGRDIRSILAPPEVFDEVWARLVRGQVVRAETVELTGQDGHARQASLQHATLRMVGSTLLMRWFLQLPPG